MREAYDLGAEALLEKPIVNDELIDIMQRSLLEPNERWRKALDPSGYPVLSRSFASLDAAQREHRIAFGRGGFCMDADQVPQEGPVSIELDFKADRILSLARALFAGSHIKTTKSESNSRIPPKHRGRASSNLGNTPSHLFRARRVANIRLSPARTT